ncbi:MAG: uracil-DNA glycosylase [Planctomycetes bacterium]|nr:uracil-DNA glycosylase [Planctomycetota bacterium]
MRCKWYLVCPLRRYEREKKIDSGWSAKYCQSEHGWRECKRYKLEAQGIYHPDNMLPNGEIDESLR